MLGKRPATTVSLSLEWSKEWFDTLPQFVRHITKVRLLHQENLQRFLKIKKYAGHTLTSYNIFFSEKRKKAAVPKTQVRIQEGE